MTDNSHLTDVVDRRSYQEKHYQHMLPIMKLFFKIIKLCKISNLQSEGYESRKQCMSWNSFRL